MTPSLRARSSPQPPRRAPSPTTNRPLRMRDLVPVPLKVLRGARAGPGRFCCAVTGKEITHQPVVLLKNTGCVMMESVFRRVAEPTMTCPITGRSFTTRDVLRLASGGTGFAAHNDVEVSKYGHSMN